MGCQELMARTFAPAWIEASTLRVPTSAMSALPESKARIALESPVTTSSSTSSSPSHPFFCATYRGSENVVAGPGNAILILDASALRPSNTMSPRRRPEAIVTTLIREGPRDRDMPASFQGRCKDISTREETPRTLCHARRDPSFDYLGQIVE